MHSTPTRIARSLAAHTSLTWRWLLHSGQHLVESCAESSSNIVSSRKCRCTLRVRVDASLQLCRNENGDSSSGQTRQGRTIRFLRRGWTKSRWHEARCARLRGCGIMSFGLRSACCDGIYDTPILPDRLAIRFSSGKLTVVLFLVKVCTSGFQRRPGLHTSSVRYGVL